MSGNNEQKKLHHLQLPKMDSRVRRTRDALGDALVALMQEKSFESITVQDVLDRANVGRSTFYVHYSDKDDLLMSDADEFFESISMALSNAGDRSNRVFPVKEFFEHVSQMQTFLRALANAGKMHENLELARGHFARGIERRLSELALGRNIPERDRPLIAFAHAGALLSLLTWWVNHDMRDSAESMDQLFHRMVWGSAK